jgi:hypothetical protein
MEQLHRWIVPTLKSFPFYDEVVFWPCGDCGIRVRSVTERNAADKEGCAATKGSR